MCEYLIEKEKNQEVSYNCKKGGVEKCPFPDRTCPLKTIEKILDAQDKDLDLMEKELKNC